MMEEYGKVKSIKSRKSSYGSSFNESMIYYNDEQETQTAIASIEGGQLSYTKATAKNKTVTNKIIYSNKKQRRITQRVIDKVHQRGQK